MYTHFLNCCSILHVSIVPRVLHFRHGGLSPVQRQHYLRVARWWETPKPRKALEQNHATLPEVWPQAIQCALLATELCHRGMPTKTLNIHVVNNNNSFLHCEQHNCYTVLPNPTRKKYSSHNRYHALPFYTSERSAL